ncbi:UDP-N-acetylglucosamine transferase subunit ALG13 homolog [Anoplophora glabripennis]|uniref:UDP-N-acetylglucosamine transferase subunit ALG13 homolog n=1 Tax=Anoplophora glabripennis TaxID=217634 RepID=UPI0008742EEB|nr:UDP-N-acetylglucosamine transferase subunit ALG13 homolog [Anoplophora glabripennis]
MEMKKVFVTVGTTKFPKLVDAITTKEIIESLISKGYNFIQIQTGRDFSKVTLDPNISPTPSVKSKGNSIIVNVFDKLTLKYDPYFENFTEEVESSDLVISHAGAGSCLEVLRKMKPLIVVVNEDLMDNHQVELAEQLQNDGYVYYSTCSTLNEVLGKDMSKLKPYPKPNIHVFSQYLDKCMGFTE